jgi:hypothetical protein
MKSNTPKTNEILKMNATELNAEYQSILKKEKLLLKAKESLKAKIAQRLKEICINCPTVPINAKAKFPLNMYCDLFLAKINSLTAKDMIKHINNISVEGQLTLIHHIEEYVLILSMESK